MLCFLRYTIPERFLYAHSLPFRWSCCCHLHWHSTDIRHDYRSDHPNNHWFVQLSQFMNKHNHCSYFKDCVVGVVCSWSTAFNKIGGYSNLERVYSMAVPSKIIPNSTCHLPRQDAMHLFRDSVTGDLPWPGMTLGLTILATWYWCTDQVHLYTHTNTCTYRQNGCRCVLKRSFYNGH